MNIQIFGKNKCFDTKKAERYFKERGIRFQRIDLAQKGISRGELSSVKAAVGGLEPLLDPKAKGEQALLLRYLSSEEAKGEKYSSIRNCCVRRLSATAVSQQWDIAPRCGKHGSDGSLRGR